MSRFIFFIGLCLSLSACVSDGVKDMSGRNIGQPEKQIISYQDSIIKVPREIIPFIDKVVKSTFPKRRVDTFTFKNSGYAFAEWIYSGYFVPETGHTFKRAFTDHKIYGKAVSPDELRVQKKQGIMYSLITRPQVQCMAFNTYLGNRIYRGYPVHVRGLVCDSKENAKFETQMFSYLAKIRFER